MGWSFWIRCPRAEEIQCGLNMGWSLKVKCKIWRFFDEFQNPIYTSARFRTQQNHHLSFQMCSYVHKICSIHIGCTLSRRFRAEVGPWSHRVFSYPPKIAVFYHFMTKKHNLAISDFSPTLIDEYHVNKLVLGSFEPIATRLKNTRTCGWSSMDLGWSQNA